MAGPATLYQSGDHASRPASGAGCVLYFCTDHDLVYRDNGSSWATLATLGAADILNIPTVETDDLLVLSPDGAGGVEFRAEAGGAGLASGISFPGSPSAGDRFRRTDLNYLIFFYDGTRWLSEQMFTMTGSERALNAGSSTTSPTRFKQTPLHTLDIYAVRLDVAWFVASPNSGSAYWTLDIKNLAESTTHISLNTSAMSGNTWTKQAWTTGAVIPASDIGLMWILTKTGSPGAFTCAPSLYYRLIAT